MERAVLACLLLCTNVRADTTAPSAAGGKVYKLASLERTACYGTCPAYQVTVWSDGRVEWNGHSYVKKQGKATATLTPAELAALRSAFEEAKYFSLPEGLDCYEATDNPSATTSYDDGKRKRTIVHYYGCRTKPGLKEVSALEARIDQIVKTAKWIGREE